jgi:histidine ammonia-lyase
VEDAGLQSGLMLAQYTAAALASEAKVHCFPASADSIPTGEGREEHVSMGPIAATKLRHVIECATRVVAVELLVAAQAIEFRRPLETSGPLERALAVTRERIAPWTDDRELWLDLERAETIIREGAILPETVS